MHALKVLQFQAIRDLLAKHCETELAVELALDLLPTFEPSVMEDLQAETGEAHEILGHVTIPVLSAVRNFGNAIDRAKKGGSLDGETLFGIADALRAMRTLRGVLSPRRAEIPQLWIICETLPELPAIENAILSALDGSGEVKDSASSKLASVRKQMAQISQRILERIQSYTTGKLRESLSDPIYTIREGRYVVPVRAEYRGKIKGLVHGTSATGHTLFIEPEEVVKLGNDLREAQGAEKAEIQRILKELSQKVGESAEPVASGMHSASSLDLIFAKARLGYAMRAVSPEKTTRAAIRIEQGRHPLLDPESVVPLDIDVGFQHSGVLITGPNTGGKTVALKTVGLFVAMAQAGLMLPAQAVRMGCFRQLWADIGDEQSLQQSLSTFSGHIKNIAAALEKLRDDALVLLDEIGAGTDPAEGASLAQALLIAFRDKGAKIVASTHYGELKVFAYSTEGFTNAAMEFDTKSLRPTYRLLMGAPGASQALRIAERYGIPREIVESARRGLGVSEQDISQMLEKLESAQKQAQRSQSEADRLSARLQQVESKLQEQLREAEVARREAKRKSASEVEAVLREIRVEAAEVLEELRASHTSTQRELSQAKLKEIQVKGEELTVSLRPSEEPVVATGTLPEKGSVVILQGHAQRGVLVENPRNGKAMVQVGSMKFQVPLSQIETVVAEPPTSKKSPRVSTFAKTQSATTEINLRMLRAEEAQEALDRFLDEAILAGLPSVRIIHGKGEGILRRLTQATLRSHKGIRSFRAGVPGEGGEGATIAILE